MSKLFITHREVDFISDLTKEITKDVRGQSIFYFKVRRDLSDVHDVYEEATNKVFDPPVEIEAYVSWQPTEYKTNRYGSEGVSSIEVFIQSRDLLDREIKMAEGDYFSYGTVFFEITTITTEKQVFGQVDHSVGMKIIGKYARVGQIDVRPAGPLGEDIMDENGDRAVQKSFVQQRGKGSNRLGETGDKRALQDQGKLDKPEKIAEISKKGDSAGIGSSFYGDD